MKMPEQVKFNNILSLKSELLTKRPLDLDFAKCINFDSSILLLLLEWLRIFPLDTELNICNLSQKLQQIMQLYGVWEPISNRVKII